MYLVHVDDPLADTTVDSSDQTRGGKVEAAVREAVASSHHQGGQAGVGGLCLGLASELAGAAVVLESLHVSAVRADHHEESPLLPPCAGELQAGGGAGEAGPEGGGAALVGDGELPGGGGTVGGLLTRAGSEAAGLSALTLSLHPPHWGPRTPAGVTGVLHGLYRDLNTVKVDIKFCFSDVISRWLS